MALNFLGFIGLGSSHHLFICLYVYYLMRHGFLNIFQFGIIPFIKFLLESSFPKHFEVKIKSIKYPIYLRGRSSDVIVFLQNLFKKEIDVPFKQPVNIFIDLGANIGTQSILMKKLYPDCKIIAVEISDENIAVLKKNLSYYSDIHLEKAAIHYKKCSVRLGNVTGDGNRQFWTFAAIETSSNNKDNIQSITVNEIVEKYGLEKIDVVKLDIEPNDFQYEVIFHNNNWLAITDNVFIDLSLGEQMKVSKDEPNEKLSHVIKKFNFQYSIKGEFLWLHR